MVLGLRRTDPETAVTAAADDDAVLVARAVHDPEAFAVLYRRYIDRVYWFCYQRLETKEAAEDATSLVFTKAFTALPHQHPGRSFRAWLFTIAHHVVADIHRSHHPTEPLETAVELIDMSPAPVDRALANETRNEVRALLLQLPADQRRILELRLVGLTGTEIAVVLGRSHGAIKIAQVRAYARIRQLLAGDAEGDRRAAG